MKHITTINIEELKDLIRYIIENNKVLFDNGKKTTAVEIVGESGLGKTSAIIQLAEERHMDYVKLNLAQLEELGDLIGFPIKEYYICKVTEEKEECLWVSQDVLKYYIEAGYQIKDNISRMNYALPAWVPTDENPNGTILILDDFNRADPRFLAAVMELINNGQYISWSLPRNCTIILTANPDNGDYNVTSMDNAQKTRYISFTIDFDKDVWARWAEEEGIDNRFINFVLSYPEIMNKEGGIQKVNPRSLVTFANTISGFKDWSDPKTLGLILNIAQGCFTSEENVVGNLFTTFIGNKLDKLMDPESMLTKDWSYVKGELTSQIYDGDSYRADIAAVLATRFLNYCVLYLSKKGSKIDIVINRILDFINNDKTLLAEDLIFNLIKTLNKNYPSKCNKLLLNPKIASKLL